MRITIETLRPAMLAPIALMIAACGDDAEPVARDADDAGAEATGEVLGGSISDDMIPLEELRSQSPLAPRATGSGSGSGDNSSDEGEDEPQSEEAEPASADPASEAPAEPAPAGAPPA